MKTTLWLLGIVLASLCVSCSATPIPQEEVPEELEYEANIPDFPVDESLLDEDEDEDVSRGLGSKIAEKIAGAGIKTAIKGAAEATKKVVKKVVKKVIVDGGKKVIKGAGKVIKEGSKKVIKGAGKVIKEGGKKVIKGAGKVIKEGGKKVIKGAGKVIKEGGKKVIKGAGKVIKEGGKKVIKVIKSKGGKMVIKGLKQAGKVVAEVGADLAMEMAMDAILSGGTQEVEEEVEYEEVEGTEGEGEEGEGEEEEDEGEEEEGEEEEGEGEGGEEDDEVELVDYVNDNQNCKCTGNKKCECCVTVPGHKEACLTVTVLTSLWENESEVRLATSYGDEKALTVKFPGGKHSRCKTLPESLGGVKLCMSSEGKALKKEVQTQCFKFQVNEDTFSKCLLETKDKISLRAI